MDGKTPSQTVELLGRHVQDLSRDERGRELVIYQNSWKKQLPGAREELTAEAVMRGVTSSHPEPAQEKTETSRVPCSVHHLPAAEQARWNAGWWFFSPLLLSSLHTCKEAATQLAAAEISGESQKHPFSYLLSRLWQNISAFTQQSTSIGREREEATLRGRKDWKQSQMEKRFS